MCNIPVQGEKSDGGSTVPPSEATGLAPGRLWLQYHNRENIERIDHGDAARLKPLPATVPSPWCHMQPTHHDLAVGFCAVTAWNTSALQYLPERIRTHPWTGADASLRELVY